MQPLPVFARQQRVPIVSNEEAVDETYVIRLKSEYFARHAAPGQFFHVRVTDGVDPLLRRPLSLHRRHPDSDCVDLLYKLKGRGTRLLARSKPGHTLDVIGPLGHGFPQPAGRVYLAAGGMGVAPFPAVVDDLCGSADVTVLLGARTASALLCVDRLQSMGIDVRTATDDGTAGHHGNVSDLVASLEVPDTIFCCGPNPMLKTLVNYALAKRIHLWAAVEQHMACGMGICRGCAIQLADEGDTHYGLVCNDGPVFSATQLSVWARED